MILLPCQDYDQAAAFFTERALVAQIEEVGRMLELFMEGDPYPSENSGWQEYPYALATYGKALVRDHEIRSGETHSAIDIIEDVLSVVGDYSRPWWVSKEAIHISHQSLMVRKQLSVSGRGQEELPVLRAANLFGHKVILVEPEV